MDEPQWLVALLLRSGAPCVVNVLVIMVA